MCTGCCSEEQVNISSEKGPVTNRSCRDVIWGLLFFTFWIGMAVIAVFSIRNGQPQRLIYGHDSFGNLCGATNKHIPNAQLNNGLNLTSRPYLFYFDPYNSSALVLCVNECPTSDVVCIGCDIIGCQCQSSLNICLKSNDNTYQNNLGLSNDGCPNIAYQSSDLLSIHRCIPSGNSSAAGSVINSINGASTFIAYLSDFYKARWTILITCSFAVGIAFVIIIMLRCCAAPLIYGTLALSVIGTIAGVGFAWFEYRRYKHNYDLQMTTTHYAPQSNNLKLYLGGSIAVSIIAVIYLLILIVMRGRIRFVVALFEEASVVIWSMPQVYLLPIINSILTLGFYAFWIVVYIYLSTSGTPVADASGQITYVDTKEYQKIWWYYIFGLFWTSCFLVACQEFVFASCVAIWYFTRNKSEVSSPVTRSIWRLIRYHFGSIAFGSFIIAVVQLVRFILLYVEKRIKNRAGTIVKALLLCLSCCLWCLEKFLKFINRNAYIEIAIYGYSFCSAARHAFKILFNNILRVATVNSLGVFVIFIAKLAVISVVGVMAMWIFNRNDMGLQFPSLIVITIMFFSYFISSIFFAVYKMTMDTLLICFCEDAENNKEAPFMSKRLQKFMTNEEKRNRDESEKAALLANEVKNSNSVKA